MRSTLFPQLEAETGMSTGYRRTGGYWLARVPERMDELRRICAVGRHMGLTPSIVTPQQVAVPQLALQDHVGALMVPEDANVNPVDLCMAYARAAQEPRRDDPRGHRRAPHPHAATAASPASNLPTAARSRRRRVVLCAGAWSKKLADEAGVALPLQAVEHMYIVTEPMPGLPNPFPVVRDLDTGIYVKGDAGRLVIGGFEPDAKVWDRLWAGGRPRLPRNAGGLGPVRPLHGSGPRARPAARRDRHPALHERARELHRRHPPLYRRDAGGRRPVMWPPA